MACIPYTYVPAQQDLFLYEDFLVTWSGGSKTVKRAVAWNPTSPLFGYRKSLVGLCARHRTFSTYCGASNQTNFEPFNAFNDANKPAFFNSFPPRFITIGRLFMLNCLHCFTTGNVNRDTSKRWEGPGGFAVDSELAASMAFRWIDHDDTVLQEISPEDVILSFKQDPSFAALNTIKDSANGNSDVEICETLTDMLAPPIVLADIRTAGLNATAWMLDGSDKIIRCGVTKAFVDSGHDQYALQAQTPAGVAITSFPTVTQFLHDSGSLVLVEISPPTSVAAGDGVMGLMPAHVFSVGDFTTGTQTRTGFGQLSALGSFAASAVDSNLSIREYCAFRGSAMPSMRMARVTDSIATEVKELEILDKAESVSWL